MSDAPLPPYAPQDPGPRQAPPFTPSAPVGRLPGALDSQPVALSVGALAAVLDAGIVAGAALGWLTLSAEQTGAVVAFVTTASTLAGAGLRQAVYCFRTVRLGS